MPDRTGHPACRLPTLGWLKKSKNVRWAHVVDGAEAGRSSVATREACWRSKRGCCRGFSERLSAPYTSKKADMPQLLRVQIRQCPPWLSWPLVELPSLPRVGPRGAPLAPPRRRLFRPQRVHCVREWAAGVLPQRPTWWLQGRPSPPCRRPAPPPGAAVRPASCLKSLEFSQRTR